MVKSPPTYNAEISTNSSVMSRAFNIISYNTYIEFSNYSHSEIKKIFIATLI